MDDSDDMITLSRTVGDARVEIELTVPEPWIEVPVIGSVVALVGDLGQPTESLRPSVVGPVEEADSADEAFTTIREALLELPEVQVIIDEHGARGGLAGSLMVVSLRHPATGALQVDATFAVFAPGPPGVVVRATGSCGGAADEDVLRRLGEIVSSLAVRHVRDLTGNSDRSR
jgi:hypothetical protein